MYLTKGQLEKTKGYRQQSEEAFQGSVLDAQYWLRYSQNDTAHAPYRIPQGLGP